MKSGILWLIVVALPTVLRADQNLQAQGTLEQLGTVHFPSSCAASVEAEVERGVALLHSFWYEEAEKQFTAIKNNDPRCAMAYWGVAMSLWHQLWNHPDEATLDRGRAELKNASRLGASPRERGYIAALAVFYNHRGGYDKRARAYAEAMERLSRENAADQEAAAFYALSLLAAEPEHDKGNGNRKKAAEVLEKLFAADPNHPGVVHYLIHAYDTPALAEQGLPAARRYAQIAPAAPHALHMPSHIFARLGLWQEDIASNVASIEATRKESAMHMGGEGHQFHAMDYLLYAYLQSGRDGEAHKLIDELRTMPPMRDMYNIGFDPRLAALSTFTPGYELELHHWKEAEKLPLVEGATPQMQAPVYVARVIGAARQHDGDEAHRAMVELERIESELARTDKGAAADVREQIATARPWIQYADLKTAQAVKSLRSLAAKNSAISEISEQVPAREMLADLLLELNRPHQAMVEYEAELKINPGRFNALYGAAQAAERMGNQQGAKLYYARLVRNCEGGSSGRDELKHARAAIAVEAEQKGSAGLSSP
ncbi:MAG: hypothetical protein JO356_09745 [Acidobacteria bacterium]|nr:hypothetical protein [Acidobacteriota bacterium]